MTDWDRIIEEIDQAMRAVDKARQAGDALRNNVTPVAVDNFTEEISTLHAHLESLKRILDHESGFSMDELTDVLSQFFGGRPASYRKTPRYGFSSKKE
jgi:hypothetical protein